MYNDKVIIIAGPTASGKSRLALSLAQKFNGEIINADSLQLYEDLKVLTARPGQSEMSLIPHHLYGLLSAYDVSTSAWWRDKAVDCIKKIKNSNKLPIVVGGTGLYLKTLIHGICSIPDIDQAIREEVRNKSQNLNDHEFYQHVISLDPIIKNKILSSDKQRLARALEVFLQTKRSIFSFYKNQRPKHNYSFISVLLTLPRCKLYRRINDRFIGMINQGAINEVQRLYEKKIAPFSSIFKAIGVRELLGYIENKYSLDYAIYISQKKSRHYAKRQVTWFRHQFKPDIDFDADNEENINRLISKNFSTLF